ncbi:MAG TPA: hypothetical protein VEF36_06945, partial [Roseiarcus sp.]|nr:hypothetical protein [Roseiarcus sp.]
NTAFTYKGKAADVKQVGRELNVRYVLEGSVQRAGARMRVNVQLIEAESGAHLWAERFDKPVAELFDMQDEIVARLANQLQATLAAVEAQRAERAVNPDSMDYYFRGLAALYKGVTLDFLDEARRHFDRALELDPRNIDALARRGYVDVSIAGNWLSADRAAQLASAEAILRRALALNSDHAFSHAAMGIVYVQTRRAEQGVAECEQALALDRNQAWAHAVISTAKYAMGRSEEVEGHIAEAMRLSPRDPTARWWAAIVGAAMMALGRDAEGSNWLTRATKISANYPFAQFLLGAALVNLGRLEEAREAVRLGLEMNPTFSLARFRAGAFSDNPVYLAGLERMYEGLRKAGVPEA